MTLIGGLPAHPLIVHGVVVLLPLAAVGTLVVAARSTWRRSLGVPVFLIALLGVGLVPIATKTGDQLEHVLGGTNPQIQVHEARADRLLPFALIFLVLLLITLLLGWRADRAADTGDAGTARTQARLTTTASVLAALAGVLVAGLVVWIGEAGATSVWDHVVAE
ncbi:DUF2231 domain-containing protein [Pseudonocardia acaciae]|uniref:DUF2231 domain-containing protein n=1 Tax=Pseudonocardia acaciae TaxID=551276 RepID=UPI00048BA525|nr:DUF2231 domain-containing protein [Pseudonocardia acaciae]